MMRAALLCLVVTLVQAGTYTETPKCEDEHDTSEPSDWGDWVVRLGALAECGKTIGDDIETLIGEIKSGGDWASTRERLDEIVQKTTKVISHADKLYGPLLAMPVDEDYARCGAVAELAEEKGTAATTEERHTALLVDAKCFSLHVKKAFTLKWLDPKYDQSLHEALFIEAVDGLLRLIHDGTEFHNGLSKLTNGMVRKSSDSGHHTDAVSDDLKSNLLERLIKALNSKP